MCEFHYTRWSRYGDPLREPPEKVKLKCLVATCVAAAIARGFCSSHYGKWHKHGDPEFVSTPQTRRKDKPNRIKDGYVRLYRPEHPNARKGGFVMEHTVVMADVIGRPLVPGESVHHRNGIRDDNSPENLELWTSMSQPSGQRVKDLVAYANAIRERYGVDPDQYP